MELQDFTNRLRQEIAKGRIGAALNLLFPSLKGKCLSDVTLLRGEYNRLNDRMLLNIDNYADMSHALNNISYRLLQMVDQITEDDFLAGSEPHSTGFSNPILVFVFTEDAKKEMEIFFQPLDFENLRIEQIEAYDPKWNNTADLTIWDNRDLAPLPNDEDMGRLKERERALILRRLPILNACLEEQPSPHFIHFGENFFLVNKKRNRINAANSFYSLFARIRETLDYINTYRV
jgi:hypothetical protein